MNDADVNDMEMGPGMDLVISILAFSLLLLALLMLERKIINANPNAEPESTAVVQELNSDSEYLREIERLNLLLSNADNELTRTSDGLVDLEKELELAETLLGEKNQQIMGLSDELVDKNKVNALLTDELALAEQRSDTLRKRFEEEHNSTTTALEEQEKAQAAEIARLERELEQVRNEYGWFTGSANAKLSSLEKELETLESLLNEERAQQEENNRRMSVELSERGDVGIFEQGKATLTPEGRRRLYRLISELRRAVALGEPNVLRVSGHASPERMADGIRQGYDNNLQLSAERSLTIAYELASLGVPLRCISIEGHGRSRSPTLKSSIDGNQSLEGFDSWYQSQNAFGRRQFLQRVAGERRVEVLVTREAEGQCSHDLLSSAVQTANTEARRRLNNR